MLALGFSIFLISGACFMAFGRFQISAANVLFSAAWGVMLLLYRLLGYNYEYILWVIAFTIACVMAWVAGELGIAWIYRNEMIGRPKVSHKYQFKFLGPYLIFVTMVGMIAPIDWAATTGIDFARIRDVGALLEAANDAHIMLAQAKVEQSLVNKVCLMVALSGVVLSGIFIGCGRPGRPISNMLLLAPILPYLSMMLLTTVRSMMIVPIIMMFGSWIAGLTLAGRDRAIFDFTVIAKITGSILLILIVILYLQGVREGDYTFSRLDHTLMRARLWFAGYEPALVAYLNRVWDHKLQYGASSFRVIVGLFTSENTALQYGSGQVDIGMSETSNAMTALRFFVEDWGLAGAVIFCAIWGGVTGWVGEITRRGTLWISPLFALLIAVAVFSPNSWFLNYGTRCFAPLLAMAYLWFFGTTSEQQANPESSSRAIRRSAKERRDQARQQLGLK